MENKDGLVKFKIMSLGIYESLYDMYIKLVEIAEDKFTGKDIFKGTADEKLQRCYKDMLNQFLGEFTSVFSQKYYKLYASIRAFKEANVQFFDMRKTITERGINIEFSFITFSSFYKMVLNTISHIIRIRDGLSNSELNVSLVKEKMFNRILDYVNQLEELKTEQDVNVDLRIFKNLSVISCNIKKHLIKPAIFKVHSLKKGILVEIPIYKCKTCGRIFIGKETLRIYEKRYGKLSVTTIKDNMPFKTEHFTDLNGESKLHRAGYTVADGKMSDLERKNLLKYLYDSKQLEAFEITRDIENAIRLFHNRDEFAIAQRKWKDDLEFFSEYVRNSIDDK